MSYIATSTKGRVWYAGRIIGDPDAKEIKYCAIGAGDSEFDDYPKVGSAVAASGNTGGSTATSGGTYTGRQDELYTIEITKGGAAGTAEYTVTAEDTGDSAGPVIIAEGGIAQAVGSKGATVILVPGVGGLFVLGDRWTISCQIVPEEDVDQEALRSEFARKRWYKKSYLVLDPNGTIMIGGLMYSETTTKTKLVAYFFHFDEDEGNEGTIREFGYFTDDCELNEAAVLEAIADEENAGENDATSGGTYAGAVNETYEVEVTTGGGAGVAAVTVTGLQHGDDSGPTVVAAFGSPVAIGSQGATISFSGTALTLGDKWLVACTHAVAGPYATGGVYDRDDNPEGEVAVSGTMVGVRHVLPPAKTAMKTLDLCFHNEA